MPTGTTRTVTVQDTAELVLTPPATGKAEMRLHAESIMEHTNGRTALTTGETKTITMSTQILSNLPTPLHKAPTQTEDIEEKSKAWKADIFQQLSNSPF